MRCAAHRDTVDADDGDEVDLMAEAARHPDLQDAATTAFWHSASLDDVMRDVPTWQDHDGLGVEIPDDEWGAFVRALVE